MDGRETCRWNQCRHFPYLAIYSRIVIKMPTEISATSAGLGVLGDGVIDIDSGSFFNPDEPRIAIAATASDPDRKTKRRHTHRPMAADQDTYRRCNDELADSEPASIQC